LGAGTILISVTGGTSLSPDNPLMRLVSAAGVCGGVLTLAVSVLYVAILVSQGKPRQVDNRRMTERETAPEQALVSGR
jgi:hypothetical protein